MVVKYFKTLFKDPKIRLGDIPTSVYDDISILYPTESKDTLFAPSFGFGSVIPKNKFKDESENTDTEENEDNLYSTSKSYGKPFYELYMHGPIYPKVGEIMKNFRLSSEIVAPKKNRLKEFIKSVNLRINDFSSKVIEYAKGLREELVPATEFGPLDYQFGHLDRAVEMAKNCLMKDDNAFSAGKEVSESREIKNDVTLKKQPIMFDDYVYHPEFNEPKESLEKAIKSSSRKFNNIINKIITHPYKSLITYGVTAGITSVILTNIDCNDKSIIVENPSKQKSVMIQANVLNGEYVEVKKGDNTLNIVSDYLGVKGKELIKTHEEQRVLNENNNSDPELSKHTKIDNRKVVNGKVKKGPDGIKWDYITPGQKLLLYKSETQVRLVEYLYTKDKKFVNPENGYTYDNIDQLVHSIMEDKPNKILKGYKYINNNITENYDGSDQNSLNPDIASNIMYMFALGAAKSKVKSKVSSDVPKKYSTLIKYSTKRLKSDNKYDIFMNDLLSSYANGSVKDTLRMIKDEYNIYMSKSALYDTLDRFVKEENIVDKQGEFVKIRKNNIDTLENTINNYSMVA
ncbi:TPA: hypothetical protein HA235_02320 [Candidatus Woesearchaeota archaeon]|nr:hypothetical protein [Candidatus Woesearchaeota archaeon]HIH31519.1 hypothetical protein [Candidatus Woesearchaeota archaeon]HIH54324.1 hypothetical protein [Candidatus Woesearchaeota archaeon]HIJ02487.1 hypothetical protein [Candidatus Woesearchaeota archaeon]HIJ13467.1 hypothetical protein [Candidatus Woesearchaeota archaeon]